MIRVLCKSFNWNIKDRSFSWRMWFGSMIKQIYTCRASHTLNELSLMGAAWPSTLQPGHVNLWFPCVWLPPPQKKKWEGSFLTWTTKSKTLWKTVSCHHYRNSENTECFGSLINRIVVLRLMVHTLNKISFSTLSVVSQLFIWSPLVQNI